MAVVVEHAGEGGGAVAAPIAREVIAKWFEKKRARESGPEDGADVVQQQAAAGPVPQTGRP